MKKRIIFVLATVIVLAIGSWITSAAYGNTNDVAGLAGAVSDGEINIEAAPTEAAPAVHFFGNYIGSVEPGDLFYIDVTSSQPDICINLYLTNPAELAKSLRYFILKVAVYVEDGNKQWQLVTSQNGIDMPDTYISLENSPVSFILPGLARYKVTIESGSYKSYPNPKGNEISPQFYLDVAHL
jgi:hypothetical protein